MYDSRRRSFVRTGFLFVCAGIAFATSACSSKGEQARDASASPGAAVIGFSVQNREAQFYQDMEAGMKAEAAKYGYSVVTTDAGRDNAKQQSQVEDFISQKVAAIVLSPYDSQAIGSAIVEANQAKIPVFTADIANGSKQGVVTTHVASDNVQGGAQAAKLLCTALPDGGEIAILDEPEVTSVQDRTRGFKAYIAASCPKLKIVADIDGGGERAKSSSATEDMLQSHPKLAGIFGINDDSALGAVKAVESAQAGSRVKIVGYDATAEARTAIAQGKMYGDAIQHPDQIGAKVIDAVHLALTGKTPPKRIAVAVGSYVKADAAKDASATASAAPDAAATTAP